MTLLFAVKLLRIVGLFRPQLRPTGINHSGASAAAFRNVHLSELLRLVAADWGSSWPVWGVQCGDPITAQSSEGILVRSLYTAAAERKTGGESDRKVSQLYDPFPP